MNALRPTLLPAWLKKFAACSRKRSRLPQTLSAPMVIGESLNTSRAAEFGKRHRTDEARRTALCKRQLTWFRHETGVDGLKDSEMMKRY